MLFKDMLYFHGFQDYDKQCLWAFAYPVCKKSKYNRFVAGCVFYFLFLCFDTVESRPGNTHFARRNRCHETSRLQL